MFSQLHCSLHLEELNEQHLLTRDFDECPGAAEGVLRAAGVVSEVGFGGAADDHGVAEAVLLHQPVLVGVQQHRVAVPLHLKEKKER